MEKFLFSKMYLYRHLVEMRITTAKFLFNNKILNTNLFFIISDFPKFAEGNNTMDFQQRFYLLIFRERGREERGRETSMCGCLSHAPYWGPSLQPSHVP